MFVGVFVRMLHKCYDAYLIIIYLLPFPIGSGDLFNYTCTDMSCIIQQSDYITQIISALHFIIFRFAI